jgi:hypothetical protein
MLRSLHESLFTLDHPLRLPGGIELGTRTTLVRLADGSLFLHSPGPRDEAAAREIAKLGEVAHVVAPNLLHNLFVKDALAEHPAATLHAPPGFERKLPGARFETLTDAAPAAWTGQIDQVAVRGAPRMNEIVFCHRASRTLLLTDLCFNVRHSDSLATRLFMRLNGAYGRFGPSRLARFLVFQDRRAVRASVDRILALDFDRVVVPHGEIVESGGAQALRDAFAGIG